MEKLKLMKWADERFPPIDLNENVGAVIELINEIKALRQNDVSDSFSRRDMIDFAEHIACTDNVQETELDLWLNDR